MIGKNAGNCLFELRKYFGKITDERSQNEEQKVDRNRSKVLINSTECDVVSLIEENEREMTIKEVHRLEHLKRIFAQCYMKSAWKDFEFINGLKQNKILSNSKQNADSFAIINSEIDECIKQISKFIVKKLSFVCREFEKVDEIFFVLCFCSLNCMHDVLSILIVVGCSLHK